MNFDTPLVEYLIIGTHTTSWLSLIVLKILNQPISIINGLDPALLLFLLPFIYVIGMSFDYVAYSLLSRRIAQIKKSIFGSAKYADESIAQNSEVLYNAYEARIRRVRIIGAAIFNWPLLGISILLHTGIETPYFYPTIVSIIGLTVLSWSIWNGLNNRAYKFRKNAIDVINRSKTSK